MPSTEPTRERTETHPAPSHRPRLSTHVRMTFDRVRHRHVLLGPETILVLNPTGAAILGLCDGQRTRAEIAQELEQRYDRVVEHEVKLFLTRLTARGYVEADDA